jgi:hypothetical protein
MIQTLLDIHGNLVHSGDRVRNLNIPSGCREGEITLDGKYWMWVGDDGARVGVPEFTASNPRFGIEKL